MVTNHNTLQCDTKKETKLLDRVFNKASYVGLCITYSEQYQIKTKNISQQSYSASYEKKIISLLDFTSLK